jgi:hypothetical protein
MCTCQHAPKGMLDILLHFMSPLFPDGSVVHSVTFRPDDGCSSSTSVKGVLLWFVCLFRISMNRDPTTKCPTFLCRARNVFRIPAHTYIYKKINADTCKYLHIITKYMWIPTYCIHVHICAGIACINRFISMNMCCMYLQVLHVLAGISLWACIAYVSAGIACMSTYVNMRRYCMYLQVLYVWAGMCRYF